MRFEWDEAKNRRNVLKHGISFDVAAEVFSDPFCFTIEDRVVGDEIRRWTIGRIANLVLIVVVHTTKDEEDEEIVRIISARPASRGEVWLYEES